MSKQYPGGIVSKTPVVPTSLSAPGIWTLNQQAAAQATNTWPFPRDPQFNYVTMLLHGDGSAGAVPATGVGAGVSTTVTNFNADASTNNFNVTINGDARSDNLNPYQAGYYSNYFAGTSGQYLNAPANAAFSFGTGDFTVEGWVYPILSMSNNGPELDLFVNGKYTVTDISNTKKVSFGTSGSTVAFATYLNKRLTMGETLPAAMASVNTSLVKAYRSIKDFYPKQFNLNSP